MPLTPIQTDSLRCLAKQRHPESHVAGGSAINRSPSSPRYSADIDLFHDRVDAVVEAADADAAALRGEGFAVDWSLRSPAMQSARVKRGGDELKLEWCYDSPFRFFPAQVDAVFGYCLHPVDLAVNKALALAGRAEIRDFVDILYLHETVLSLGAIVWAACGKDQGFTPWSLMEHAKRHMKFREEDLAAEHLVHAITLPELKSAWLAAASQAEELFAKLPVADVGCLYLTTSLAPFTPDPTSPEFHAATRHFGSRGGAWPGRA